jgi:hypothetical protein
MADRPSRIDVAAPLGDASPNVTLGSASRRDATTWRIGLGIVAVAWWSVVIGFPVLLFHLRVRGLVPGEHIHAAILFFASQGLVFWIVARPRPKRNKPATVGAATGRRDVRRPSEAVPELSTALEGHRTTADPVWDAEVVPADASQSSSDPPMAKTNGLVTRVLIGNYLGSSRSRRVTIEPGGENYTLLPGQNLEVTATGQTAAPSFRIVESDLATQLFIEGGPTNVTAVLVE